MGKSSIKKNNPICQSCYDKGFFTVFEGYHGSDEWSGLVIGKNPEITKKVCTICEGRPKAYARKQIKMMLIGVRNGGFITPVLNKIMGWVK